MHRRLLIFIYCLFPLWVFAQQASISKMVETRDFISGDDQRRDFNNDLCALVKVQIVDEITDVEGNVMGDIINKGVEKWVYMAKGSKKMKIHLKRYLPVEVEFNNYKIKALQSNRVYNLVLNINEKTTDNNVKLDRVEMKDMSYILCKIVSVKGGYISFKQDELEGILKVPIKEVSKIKYVSGAQKNFK